MATPSRKSSRLSSRATGFQIHIESEASQPPPPLTPTATRVTRARSCRTPTTKTPTRGKSAPDEEVEMEEVESGSISSSSGSGPEDASKEAVIKDMKKKAARRSSIGIHTPKRRGKIPDKVLETPPAKNKKKDEPPATPRSARTPRRARKSTVVVSVEPSPPAEQMEIVTNGMETPTAPRTPRTRAKVTPKATATLVTPTRKSTRRAQTPGPATPSAALKDFDFDLKMTPTPATRMQPKRTPKTQTPIANTAKTFEPQTPTTGKDRGTPGSSKPKKLVLPLPPAKVGPFALPNLPCRETQYEEIWSFLKAGVEERDSRCLYVSGVPGTGKTLVVKEVLHKLLQGSPESFHYIFVNSLTLGNPDRLWSRMHKGLGLVTSKTKSVKKTNQLQAKIENFLQADHLPVILVVDELDQLLDKRQSILYTLLEWTSHPSFRFSFIAIFNTMNLPETALAARNSSRMGFNRVVFAPYTHQELQRIVAHHLGESRTGLLQDALVLLSRKVAGISGDARRAIEIANRTLEIIEAGADGSGGSVGGARAIQDAFKELFSSPHINFLKSCSKLEKEVVRRLAAMLQATGADNTSILNVVTGIQSAATYEGNPKWTTGQILAAISRLYATKLVLIEVGRGGPSLHGAITLGVAVEDVNYALGLPTVPGAHED